MCIRDSNIPAQRNDSRPDGGRLASISPHSETMVRSSLGGAALSSTSARYPMYVIPVKTLLKLQQWEPHQNLLAKGKLVEVTPEVDLEIVFVSHQWTSFEHPDPTGEQLARLQAVLRQLMAGQTSVMGNPQLQVIYSSKFETKGEQWAATLPKVCVWFCLLYTSPSPRDS